MQLVVELRVAVGRIGIARGRVRARREREHATERRSAVAHQAGSQRAQRFADRRTQTVDALVAGRADQHRRRAAAPPAPRRRAGRPC